MNKKINVCLIGYGYWGRNILRVLIENRITGKVFVYDKEQNRCLAATQIYSNIITLKNFDEILTSSEIEAVIIATPTSSHTQLATELLKAGKHILVEKPLTTNLADAKKVFNLSLKVSKVLMVDHIFLYNQTIKQMKQYVNESFIGKINYIDATRINLGIYQNDINVLWDLACHDISIINYLLEEKPKQVRAIGRINKFHGSEDLSYIFLYYPSGILVQINSSWASPVKIRKMIIGGEKKMIIYDDVEPTNKLVIYDYEQNIKFDDSKTKLTDYRLGNITIPKYEIHEPLKNVLNEFYDCIIMKKHPLADGNNALGVINILEKAELSLHQNGKLIELN